MTANFKQFKEFVEKKFGSLSNFSKIVTGSFQTFKGLVSLKDTKENQEKIDTLMMSAEITDFDVSKVEISDFERGAIKARMQLIIETSEYKSAFKWLKKNHISSPLYSAIIGGRAKRKNLAFERLWTKLGL